uniref:Uncharacterized protein n=1 Tax=Anguilla anguilla TaxID=7936 RepID=A0A0E9TNQ4_ANGAN
MEKWRLRDREGERPKQ